MPKLFRTLYFQVLLAIALGALLGAFAPDTATSFKPLGDAFIKLIKMLIAPLIFVTVVTGVSGSGDLKGVGRTGGLALLYFEVVSTLALLVGLVTVNLLRPGAGMNIDPTTLNTGSVAAYTNSKKIESISGFLLDIIPNTFLDAFAKGEILQVLFLALLCGIALQRLGQARHALLGIFEHITELLFEIVRFIMYLAPLGAFGAMAFTIGSYGLASLLRLASLMATFYLTCVIFIFVVLGLIARFHGFSLWRFLRFIQEELLIVLGTSSSEAALPRLMAKLESLGVSRGTVGLVVPTGYSFNLDGTSIYLTMAALFIAQATNTPLTWQNQLTLLAVLLLTSKGAAGVTGSGFVVLAATLSAVGNIPVGGLALILGIDRFMSEARALTNIIGNGIAAIVVASWTGDLDRPTLTSTLARGTPLPPDQGVIKD
ncbi:MAG: dicarboxylate/amino acid:cation symporter [Bryobacter sp.]|nr:dicarboxylate/amino acid:cation symporter [Bryobacter sp.]